MLRCRPAVAALTLAVPVFLAGCAASAEQGPAPAEVSPGAATSASEADVLTVEVGDCIASDVPTGGVASVPVVPCDQPHESEVFLVHALDGDVFPGDAALSTAAQERCLPAFEEFVGLGYQQSVLEVASLNPTQATWDSGDRALVCVVVDPHGGVTGSLAMARR